MKYFCNSKLENLKNLNNFVGKTLTFAGIVTNVQYKTAKNGKDWAMFTLEGYDESHEFRIFDEDYLKFRHFLVNNQFVYFKVMVKDGWVNRETGKKSEPRLQFTDVKQLQDVLPQFAKKLSIQMDIHELQTALIQQLNHLFTANKGEHTVSFEVVEFEKVLKPIEPLPKVLIDDEIIIDTDTGCGSTSTNSHSNFVTESQIENPNLQRIVVGVRKNEHKVQSQLTNQFWQCFNSQN
jgi:DNA polymerase-3 subunit alpha